MTSNSELINVCFDSRAQRLMVKTTQKSDLPWSAIFSLIVCWIFSFNAATQVAGKMALRNISFNLTGYVVERKLLLTEILSLPLGATVSFVIVIYLETEYTEKFCNIAKCSNACIFV